MDKKKRGGKPVEWPPIPPEMPPDAVPPVPHLPPEEPDIPPEEMPGTSPGEVPPQTGT